jgi:hypothetical protein
MGQSNSPYAFVERTFISADPNIIIGGKYPVQLVSLSGL